MSRVFKMYVIGLTGNIATGKSTVCSILEQLGARVIDADQIAHAVLKRGTPAWRSVVEAFGYDILQYDGTVDRRKLGGVVFNNAAKLRTLERITHPAVGSELALLVRNALDAPGAGDQVVVIEAVKLYEAGMHEYMDALWVVTAPAAEQKRRLIQERGMNESEAEARLRAQPPPDEKLKHADVVIDNGGSIEETRVQVMRAFVALDPSKGGDKTPLMLRWLRIAPPGRQSSAPDLSQAARAEDGGARDADKSTPHDGAGAETSTPASAEWTVRRAKPGDARLLAELLMRIEARAEPLGRAEMLERLGKYGYWLVGAGERTIALAAWQAENLAAIVRELWVLDDADAPRAFPQLLAAIEAEANQLTCEVVVILVPERAAALARIAAESAEYAPVGLDELHKLWRSVIEPLRQHDEPMYAKRLREMVTKPI